MTGSKDQAISGEASETEVAEELHGETSHKAKGKAHKKESLRERLKAAEAKAEANYERLQRVTADFENYKKRSEREMNEFRKFANESLIKEILPIVDNLERALATEHEENEDAFKGIREGVEMTLKGLMDSLERFGVVRMETLGKPFDPNFHQAVSQEESEKHPENTVLHELQKGYMLRDRLVRPPMVVVSRRPDARAEVKPERVGDKSETKITVH